MILRLSKVHNNKSVRGFTLIELTVSLVIFGFVIALSIAVVRAAILSLDRAKRSSNGMEEVELAQSLLRNTLQEISVGANMVSGGTSLSFKGHSAVIDCYSVLPRSFREREPMHIQIFAEIAENDMKNLIISWQPSGERGETRKLRVLTDIKDCAFQYYGVAEGGGARWFDSWNRDTTLPKLISVMCDFTPGDFRKWPELVVDPPRNSARTSEGFHRD